MSAAPVHILMTGASRGLGAVLCDRHIEAGRRVTVLARSPQRWRKGVTCVEANLLAPETLARAVDEAESQCPVDVLINCAGVGRDGLLVMQDEGALLEMAQVNLLAPMLLMRQAAKHMIRRRSGRIINITSISAERSLRGLAAYGAFKAGLNQLTRNFAAEIAGRGISVNAIAPGYLETDMTAGLSLDQTDAIKRRTPAGRTATPEDVARLVEFALVAPETFTGQVMTIDGGFSL